MRTFVAVDAPGIHYLTTLQSELLEAAKWTRRDVKPVESENFHFTLIFLGEVNEGQVRSVIAALSKIRFERFFLKYRGLGAFPTADSARVIWAGVDDHAQARLAALAQQVVSIMAELGFRQDKPFSPHLTLLRARDRPLRAGSILQRFQAKAQLQDTIMSTPSTLDLQLIDKVRLKKSDLRPSGPVYSNVYTVDAAPAL